VHCWPSFTWQNLHPILAYFVLKGNVNLQSINQSALYVVIVNMTFFRYGYVFLVGATTIYSIHGHTLTVLQSLNVSIKFVNGG